MKLERGLLICIAPGLRRYDESFFLCPYLWNTNFRPYPILESLFHSHLLISFIHRRKIIFHINNVIKKIWHRFWNDREESSWFLRYSYQTWEVWENFIFHEERKKMLKKHDQIVIIEFTKFLNLIFMGEILPTQDICLNIEIFWYSCLSFFDISAKITKLNFSCVTRGVLIFHCRGVE